MSYYKLINGQTIVGVVSLNDFRRYQAKHGLVLFSDIEAAQYVEFRGVYYRDDWLRATITESVPYETVSIITIDKTEYDALVEAFETNDEIEIEPTEEPVIDDQTPIDENDQITIDFIRNAKIEQMSKICHDTIVNGIDVVLSDGESHHFSLEIEDQIKIQALALKAQNGAETLFWHEDDKPCQFYSASDIMTIYDALETIQTFETTWFNSLKMYIMSMDTVEQISAVTYRMDIPVEYQSEVLKYLLSQINKEG